MKSILVVAAHPDDEVLGAGGAMARWSAEGHEVHIVIMAEGATSRDDSRDAGGRSGELQGLAACAENARKAVGAATVTLENFPDNRMDGTELLDVVKVVERHVEQHRPEIVLTHGATDVNVDHRMVHEAVLAATRPQPGHCVKTLLFFEIMSSTEWRPPASMPAFQPNYFVDITDHLPAKLAALEAYAPEMRDWPHSRSIPALEHLARWRGACVGVAAAEAFAVGRIIA